MCCGFSNVLQVLNDLFVSQILLVAITTRYAIYRVLTFKRVDRIFSITKFVTNCSHRFKKRFDFNACKKEHIDYIKHLHPEKSALAKHTLEMDHRMNWSKTQIVDFERFQKDVLLNHFLLIPHPTSFRPFPKNLPSDIWLWLTCYEIMFCFRLNVVCFYCCHFISILHIILFLLYYYFILLYLFSLI